MGPKRNETDIHLYVSSKKILATQQLSAVLFRNYFTLTPPNLHGKRFCPRKGILKNLWRGREFQNLGGGFKYLLFSPRRGEIIPFDEHMFQMGGEKPPPEAR